VALDGYRCGEGVGSTSRKTIARPRVAAKREQPAAALAIRSTEMGFDKKEMIEQLKFEIEMIEKGGYYPSVREPRQNPEIFRDSIPAST
jgi:hypothetical protein